MSRVLALVALAAAGCVPTVRAPAFYAAPLLRPAHPSAPVEARWRIEPAPPGCAHPSAPLVFLPALGLTQHTWTGVTARLAACRARVLLDLPGVGEAPLASDFSAEAALRALADVVDAVAPGGPVVLVGHSLGGALATRLALRLGARVEALVLVSAPLGPIPLTRWERLLLHAGAWPPLFHLAGGYAGVGLGLQRVSGGGDRASPIDVALIAADWSDEDRRRAIAAWYRGLLAPAELEANGAALAQLRVPTLLVWGAQDAIVPSSVARAAEARKPDAASRILPGVGHLAPLSAAPALAAAIDEFLAAHPSAAAPPSPASASVTVAGRRPGDVLWGPSRELFPLVGVGALFPADGRTDLSFVIGLARGGLDPRYPLGAGRVAVLAGPALRLDRAGAASFAYLRATARLELVWRWAGGFHVDGTLLVDPRDGRTGGYGAVGYSASVVPWLRAFIGGGALPGDGARLLFGVELVARLTGWLF